ncbi:MAG: FAD-binding protein [Candidatus Thiodiazotropha sp. (ex Cardiolucina cf. quadrata)]|nr:FAD-binding protein [Candidatus Thiodiazotropha sp. (ex Cardiolucina cf. quadrata)]
MGVLVVAEHDNVTLRPTTLNTVTAAAQLGEVVVLVAGQDCESVAHAAASLQGVVEVLIGDDASYANGLAEPLARLVATVGGGYSHLLAPASTFGKNLMPRVAALLDVAQISEIIEVIDPDTFKRPIYAGNAVATVKSGDAVKVLTVRGTAFEAASKAGDAVRIMPLKAEGGEELSRFVSRELTESARPELISARVVVAGGRGLGSGDNFALLEALADKLDGAIGASRAAVDAGFVPNDYQVGQTGKIVAPEIYFAIGISGAIQHLAGMKDSKVIVAINKDEDAPIFEVADYGLVADLFDVVPELTAALD